MTKYIIGIDEAGRGPIAGPVSIGAVCIPKNFSKWPLKRGLRDSKKLSEKKRIEVYQWMKTQKDIVFSTALVPATMIDSIGIVPSIKKGISGVLGKVVSTNPSEYTVLLDGGLHAPEEFMQQKTIIKGDEKELAIALASIAAKVERDAYMIRQSKKYPTYGFEKHKGYGTKAHYEAIHTHGITSLHRTTFLKKVIS